MKSVMCGLVFMENKIRDHIIQAHNRTLNMHIGVKCDMCDTTFYNYINLIAHKNYDHHLRRYTNKPN